MASGASEVTFNTAPLHAALDEVRDLWGNGGGIPEQLKADFYSLIDPAQSESRLPETVALVDWSSRTVGPGRHLTALVSRLRMVRGNR